MHPLISHLTKAESSALFDDLNYLNMEEIKAFCRRHGIPFTIAIETPDGGRRRTRDEDRKGVVLERMRHYLSTGEIMAQTCLAKEVVRLEPPSSEVKETDRLYYGQYGRKHAAAIALLERLTNGQFRDGALARILAREFWTSGTAPTYLEFAQAWLAAKADHQAPNPEWAFLTDRFAGKETGDWKRQRAEKAARILALLMPSEPDAFR